MFATWTIGGQLFALGLAVTSVKLSGWSGMMSKLANPPPPPSAIFNLVRHGVREYTLHCSTEFAWLYRHSLFRSHRRSAAEELGTAQFL